MEMQEPKNKKQSILKTNNKCCGFGTLSMKTRI
jgi:hypothetical protein